MSTAPTPLSLSGHIALALDGMAVGFLQSASGGGASAPVIAEPPGPQYYVKKHLGPRQYEDLVLQFDWSQAPAVYD